VDKRFTVFAILVAALFVANQLIYSFFFPPEPAAEIAQKADVTKAKDKAAPKAAEPPAVDETDTSPGGKLLGRQGDGDR